MWIDTFRRNVCFASSRDVCLRPLGLANFPSQRVLRILSQTLKDVVATVDYKVPKIKGTVLNTKYDLGTKKWQAGATWDGTVANKASTVKLWYSNKDSKVAGETTVAVNKDQKANVTFNQNKVRFRSSIGLSPCACLQGEALVLTHPPPTAFVELATGCAAADCKVHRRASCTSYGHDPHRRFARSLPFYPPPTPFRPRDLPCSC